MLTWACVTLLSHRGRKLTPQGQRDLDRIAGQVSGDFSHPLGASSLDFDSFLLWRVQPGKRGCRRKNISNRLPVTGLGDRLECGALGEGRPGPGCSQLVLFCRARSLTGHSVSPGQPSNCDCRVSSLLLIRSIRQGATEHGLHVEANWLDTLGQSPCLG